MALCVLTCWCMSSQKSVCRHAHVFYVYLSLHMKQLVLVCVLYKSMFFSLFCLSMHLFVSGYTGPWLCVCASCCTSAWPTCLHAWAQLDFVSCHMYQLGFSPQPPLCWGFAVVLGQTRFRNNSSVMDWVEMGMTCPRNISCLTEEDLTALCTCQPHSSHLALLKI